MKKCTLFLFVMLMSLMAQAGDLTGIKIYVNPGHGGYDGDDRSVWTIPVPELWTNPAGYWESKSNLVKSLALRDMLQAAGATVFMSRIANTSADDRDLTAIAAEANDNEVDHFLSIHSNAMGSANSITNHVLMLYHGYDNQPTVAASLPMAQSFGAIQQSNQLTVWQNTAPSIRGDFTFYGNTSGLGVLRPLNVPGFLSEGSFHDYAPETHRLCNDDFCKLEAIRFFKHFHNYFNRDMPPAATIAGWVKSENERVDVLNQPKFVFRAGSEDQWKPINGATVTLLDESGTSTLQTYTTDDWYNGIYAFYNLTAGKYKVRVEATGYETKTVDVTAVASDIAYAKVRIFNPDYAMNAGLEPDYPDGGTVALNHYDFVQQGSTATFDALNSLTIKRVLFRNNKFYVLTTDPKILVFDAATQAPLGELSQTGVSGGDVTLSDIAFTADGKLVACNRATISLPETGGAYFKVYKWDADNAAPTLLFQSQKQGNWTTGVIGETFATAGASDHLQLYTTAVTTGSSKQIRIVAFEFLAATSMLVDKYMGGPDAVYTEAEWGAHPKFTISPSGKSDHFIVDSEIFPATEYQFDWEQPDRSLLGKKGTLATSETPVISQGVAFARYAGHSFMAVPICAANGSAVSVALYDVTGGLDAAVKISDTYPAGGLGATPAGAMLAGIAIDGPDIVLVILAQNQGTARYKTEQGPVANIYASELSYADDKFNFVLNEDAISLTIAIYKEGEWVQTHDAGALPKGAHTINNPFGNAVFDSYAITATARPNIAVAKISDTGTIAFTTPRGLAIDKNESSPFFGHIYISDSKNTAANGGIYVFDATLADVTGQGSTPWTPTFSVSSFSPHRLSIAPDNRLVIADWGDDQKSGVYLWNPATPATDAIPVFGGTVLGTNGLATESGVSIHGSISQALILGKGEDAKLYTYDEDLPTILHIYNIGNLTTPWTAAPSIDMPTPAGLANKNGMILSDNKGGFWLGQHRWEDNSTNPGVMHIDAQGTRDFNSKGELTADTKYNTQGAIALNVEQTLLATVSDNNIKVFAISYDAAGVPSIPATPTYVLETTFATTCYSLDFDAAGNLYASGAGKALHVWTFPKADNSYTTRASIDKGTSIDAPKTQSEVAIYPNPVTSELTIDGQGTQLEAYTLFDLNGRTVRSEKITGTKHTTSAAAWTPGTYILRIQTADGIVSKRIIKK